MFLPILPPQTHAPTHTAYCPLLSPILRRLFGRALRRCPLLRGWGSSRLFAAHFQMLHTAQECHVKHADTHQMLPTISLLTRSFTNTQTHTHPLFTRNRTTEPIKEKKTMKNNKPLLVKKKTRTKKKKTATNSKISNKDKLRQRPHKRTNTIIPALTHPRTFSRPASSRAPHPLR